MFEDKNLNTIFKSQIYIKNKNIYYKQTERKRNESAYRNEKNFSIKNKLGFSARILNVVFGGVLFADFILIITLIVLVRLAMSFSLFFMSAIPAFIVFCCLAPRFWFPIVNTLTGVEASVASVKGGNKSYALTIVSLALDCIVITVNKYRL